MAAVAPLAMAVFARMAPRGVAALMMGLLNASAFGGALATGFVGSLLGQMTGIHFWVLHAELVAAGGASIVFINLVAGSNFNETPMQHAAHP